MGVAPHGIMAQSECAVRCVQDCLAVILAAGRGSRMYPLTEGCPKCLLPVANKPLIWYSVQMLRSSGFQEAVVVVKETESSNVLEVLNQLFGCEGFDFSLVQIPDSDDWGTADSLRHLRGKLKLQHSNILVVSCDLVTSVQVHLLMEFHSCHQSTLTCLLAHSTNSQEESTIRKHSPAVERDIIGLTADHQVVYFAAQADLEDSLTLSRALLKRYPHMRVNSRLTDAHLYLMQRWVLDYLAENRTISSVKGELVPHLVRHQWTQAEATKMGSSNRQALKMHASSSLDKTEQLALELSSFAGYDGTTIGVCSPFLRCHALEVSDQLCLRVNSISSFMEANRQLPYLPSETLQASLPVSGLRRTQGVSGDCSLGDSVQLGERVSIKHSAVGNHCNIGDRSKITNCVLMDHVTIGEGVTLLGCVICSHAHIESRVSLKECLVGMKFTVTREADMKGETLVLGGGLHI